MADWNIQSRSRRCQACEQPFADKTPYYTLLFQQRHHLERLDVCQKCWNAQYGQGATDRKGFISFWQGIFSVPPPPPPEPIPKENAEGLLRRLCADADPEFVAIRYILAAMLERKRILKVKAQTVQEGQRVFIYEHTRSGDVFTIHDPDLRLDQLEAVQQKASQLLQHGYESFAASSAQAHSAIPIGAPNVNPPEDSAPNSSDECNSIATLEQTTPDGPVPLTGPPADS